MPTISEILAAKKAAAAGVAPQPAALPAAPKKSIAQAAAEVAEDNALLARLTPIPLGKPSLVLSKELPATTPTGEPRGQATPIKGPDEIAQRCLVETEGETFDQTPLEADPCIKDWHKAVNAFSTDLCIMRDPIDPERAWLAVRLEDEPMHPLLLRDLPLYEHPRTARQANHPF